MNIIELILFVVIVVFVVVLLVAKKKKPVMGPVLDEEGRPKVEDHRTFGQKTYATLYDWAKSLTGVLLFVFIFRSFIFEPFRIPSGSMIPTLLVGDFVAVKKWSYGVRLPLIHNKIIETGEPQRGDVMVFRYPPKPSQAFIKRLIGVPGDTITYKDKKLLVNGEPVVYEDAELTYPTNADVYFEQLDDKNYLIQNTLGRPTRNFTTKVPEGNYFVMGDNRDNSADSRYWGYVPDENLIGKAVVVWVSFGGDFPFIRFSRIGSIK